MIYTIVKETTTFETYSVTSDSPENAVRLLKLDHNTYLVESDTIEPGEYGFLYFDGFFNIGIFIVFLH